MGTIKVLVVDDSALVRELLKEIIDSFPDMRVVATAPDPLVAREKIKSLNPDVLTLDVEMPRMDGIDFLEKLMRLRPMPVVMISSLTQRGAEVTLRALELGAVDFITKPKLDVRRGIEEYAELIAEKIRAAASARVRARRPSAPNERSLSAEAVLPSLARTYQTTEKLVILGASTGGTEAIRDVLERMPADSPAFMITQHMPPGFTKSFAKRLDGLCRMRVKEAEDGERVLPGHVYIAPGDRHLLAARSGAAYHVELSDGPPVNRHRPSVDVLFRSAANCIGSNAVGVILTGMGKDGAHGLLEMKQAGARTIAQDESTSVVFGMPKEAIALGAAEQVLALDRMPEVIMRLVGALAAARV